MITIIDKNETSTTTGNGSNGLVIIADFVLGEFIVTVDIYSVPTKKPIPISELSRTIEGFLMRYQSNYVTIEDLLIDDKLPLSAIICDDCRGWRIKQGFNDFASYGEDCPTCDDGWVMPQ